MELKDKLSFGAKKVDYLIEEYFNREKTLGYCKACPNYAAYWSCPPYIFDEEIFLRQFKLMHVIGRQYEIPKADIRNIRDQEGIADYCKEKLEAIKVMTWKTLLEIESEVEGAVGLIPGNCPICEVQGISCARKTNEPCRHSEMKRYSLESLGFNVVDLVKYEVGMTIAWPENFRLPDTLTSVSAILCNEEISKEVLKKFFPDKKKSWLKYDATQLDTGFHTTETIKPEETVHGLKSHEAFGKRLIDEEIPSYRPQKSWLGYKAEKDPEESSEKKGWTVTVQGEEFEEVLEKIGEVETTIFEEEVVEEPTETTLAEEEIELTTEEEDDSKYQWLGFKRNLDDDEIQKRPIPKMTELILEGEEIVEESEASPELIIEPIKEEMLFEGLVVEETKESLEENQEEEEDSKYQWLGFKANLEDGEEPLQFKSTLDSLVIPE
ncbi:MAG: DUF2284 domain-containing protein [Eubacteriaceae bacterium]